MREVRPDRAFQLGPNGNELGPLRELVCEMGVAIHELQREVTALTRLLESRGIVATRTDGLVHQRRHTDH